MRRLLLLGAATAVSTLALAACGGPASESAAARARLRTDVATLRADVLAHHEHAAETALARLRADIGRLEADGQLPRPKAQVVLTAAEGVGAELHLLIPSTTTTTTGPKPTTTTTTRPAPTTTSRPGPPPHHGSSHHHHGKGEGGDG